jgi:hypothetical protein
VLGQKDRAVSASDDPVSGFEAILSGQKPTCKVPLTQVGVALFIFYFTRTVGFWPSEGRLF